ncbi:hypothetical protein NVP2275O_464 [Vibrio phage 2.275.O._10N.286.54.E11]|nr:hypothetical protein NVP2275O_464 [Vibrio phage 2.275.O._10N.286.54.E11]
MVTPTRNVTIEYTKDVTYSANSILWKVDITLFEKPHINYKERNMYIDAMFDRKKDCIRVAERINGKRLLRDIRPVYEFYAEDPQGTITSVTGKAVTHHRFSSNKDMKLAAASFKSQGLDVFESDVNVLNKTLAYEYKNEPAPNPNIAFFDIETDFDKIRGYAPVDNPFNKITAVSLYLDWKSELLMLALKPQAMSQAEAESIVGGFDSHEGTVILCPDEKHMLNLFFQLIEDADILSGWNSEFYDIPYMVNRTEMVMSKADTTRFCLWGQTPKPKTVEKFGTESPTYDLVGRIHMDYLALYRKHTYQELPSYKLDAIGEREVGENKVEYERTLDHLYNFEFGKFLEYGLQDSKLLKLLNDKLDYISLHNQMAHDESVCISTTMGSVALIDTAIINEIHTWGEVVFDKMIKPEPEHGAAGAWVADPVKGVHDYIGCIDLNSLYPSVLRSLKMSTESIIGQVRHIFTDEHLKSAIDKQRLEFKGRPENFKPSWTEAWHGLFACIEHTKIMNQTDDDMIIDLEDGTTLEMTASEIYDFIFSEGSNIVISANGTLYDNTKRGAIPSILTRWYQERQLMQRAVMDFTRLSGFSENEDERGMTDDQISVVLNGFNSKQWIEHNVPELTLEKRDDNKWYATDGKLAKVKAAFYKQQQQIRKILLNSLYGALLNKGSRFFDQRLGQSVTLTGRSITKHMACKINEEMTGNFDYVGGPIVYGDTDSVYFSVQKYLNEQNDTTALSKEDVVDLYLQVAENVDESFPGFMNSTFNTGLGNGKIIAAGLEIAGTRGLFLKKKRYGILKYWEDGFRLDTGGKPGKLKAMGMEIKRSDTPKYIQDHLSDVFTDLLVGSEAPKLKEKVMEFKKQFKVMDSWRKGAPKTVKNLTNRTKEYRDTGKCKVGHVLASIHWNDLRKMNNDHESPEIIDGTKIVVCQLTTNPLGMDSVAFPAEMIDRLPEWYTTLPFDVGGMEEAILTKKLDNLFGILDMDLGIFEDPNSAANNTDLFDW